MTQFKSMNIKQNFMKRKLAKIKEEEKEEGKEVDGYKKLYKRSLF